MKHISRFSPDYEVVRTKIADRVDRSSGIDGCHEWTWCTNPGGYGALRYQGEMLWAHRVAMELHLGVDIGSTPSDVFVCHHCDNPKCANPNHLFLGSNADNMNDMVAKGRSNKRSAWHNGTCKRGHDITDPSNVYTHPTHPGRECRACRRLQRERLV